MPRPTEFTVERVHWPQAEPDIRAVREAVFVAEQGVPLELEWDGLDGQCRHVLARGADGAPVGTGRLLPDGHIGRMCVLAAWRGRGIGRALLAELLDVARQAGLAQVCLDAQTHALGFYQRLGFVAHGPEFLDAGIPHRKMTRGLAGQRREHG